jgi:hypothetical protein
MKRKKEVITFMLPEDLDYHTDEDGNILCFDSLDELMGYCNESGISLEELSVFTVTAEEEI